MEPGTALSPPRSCQGTAEKEMRGLLLARGLQPKRRRKQWGSRDALPRASPAPKRRLDVDRRMPEAGLAAPEEKRGWCDMDAQG